MVGSGATGAEFASAYHALRCEVVLVSSRSQVLPSKDSDAARVIQEAFETRGVTILSQSHAVAARRAAQRLVPFPTPVATVGVVSGHGYQL